MTISFDKVANRIFQILKSRGYNLKMYKENGEMAFDPSLEARKFYIEEEGIMVAINRSGDDSEIKIYISADSKLENLETMLLSLRQTANFFGLLYNVRKYGKRLTPKEFAFLAYRTQREEEEEMNESKKWMEDKPMTTRVFSEITRVIDKFLKAEFTPKQIRERLEKLNLSGLRGPMKLKVEEYIQKGYKNLSEAKDTSSLWGTSQSSYQRIGSKQARLVVRHSQPVDEDKFAARSRHISKIFIENADGERIKFPVIYLQGARAMTRHVSMGGNFNDVIGEHIQNISEEFAILRTFKKHAGRKLHESASSIIELVRTRSKEITNEVKSMQGPKSYKRYVANFEVTESTLEEDILVLETRRVKKIFDSIQPYDGIDEAFTIVARLSRMNENFEDLASLIESGEISFKPKREMARPEFASRSASMLHKLHDLAERASDARITGFISRIAEKIQNEIPMERSELDLVKNLVGLAEGSSTAVVESLDGFLDWMDGYMIEGSPYLDKTLRSKEQAEKDIADKKNKPKSKKRARYSSKTGKVTDDMEEGDSEERARRNKEDFYVGGTLYSNKYGHPAGELGRSTKEKAIVARTKTSDAAKAQARMDKKKRKKGAVDENDMEEKSSKPHWMKGKNRHNRKTKKIKYRQEGMDEGTIEQELEQRSTNSLKNELSELSSKKQKGWKFKKIKNELDNRINETENVIRIQELAGIKKKINEADPYGGAMFSPYDNEHNDADINKAFDEANYYVETELVDEVNEESLLNLQHETQKYLNMIGLGDALSEQDITDIIRKVYPANELGSLKSDLAKDPILKTKFRDHPKSIIDKYQKR